MIMTKIIQENKRKKERKFCIIILMIKKITFKKKRATKEKKEKCDNLNDSEKEKLRNDEKEGKKPTYYNMDGEKR